MSLTLYFHPLASFCWKPLIALYENQTPFIPKLVDLGNEDSRQEFLKVWPMGEFPVLHDSDKNQTIPQSAIIIEYLNLNYPGPIRLIPTDLNLALETRRWEQFYDSYLQLPMQLIVAECMRPENAKDPLGVKEARETIKTAYEILEKRMNGKTWSVGETFTLADCSAAPALFYADQVEPFSENHPSLTAYLARLKQRPSFARVLTEAKPYFQYFPYKKIEV
jgi:glutathione S-transferase